MKQLNVVLFGNRVDIRYISKTVTLPRNTMYDTAGMIRYNTFRGWTFNPLAVNKTFNLGATNCEQN